MMLIRCTQCQFTPERKSSPYICPVCGGYFDGVESINFSRSDIDLAQLGIWRYRSAFNLPSAVQPVSLGEGNTPLVWSRIDGKEVAFKLDYINPTGSYKDRGSTVLISFLSWLGIEQAVEDSSGNAGASFAGYCSRAGMRGKVYVPSYASGPKRAQIEAYGCELIPVDGPRSNASVAVKKEADSGAVYASHVYQPHGIAGCATAAFEIFEQIGSEPGSIILPAGQGGFLLGISRGFEALRKAGEIKQLPQIIGVQSEACAPLWAALQPAGKEGHAIEEGETLAEGIRISKPLREAQVLAAVKSSNGWIELVRERDILPGRDMLAQEGFYVEPTSAVVWPALMQTISQLREPVVVVLTGSGLKYADSALKSL